MQLRFLNLIIFLLLSLGSAGQVLDHHNFSELSAMEKGSYSTGALYYYTLGANTINNKFLSSVYRGDYIDNSLKDSNPVAGNNYLGSQQNIALSFSCLPDSIFGLTNTGFRAGVYDHTYVNAQFSEDLYDLAFYGNSMFAGDTANFSGLSCSYLRYQELQLGIFGQVVNSSGKTTFYGGISLLKGQKFDYIYITNGKLYTEETGACLDLVLAGGYFTSDTAKNDITAFNGIGGCLNFGVAYDNTVSDFGMNASLTHLGTLRWNENTSIIRLDTSLHYEGIVLNDLAEFDSVEGKGFVQDTLEQAIEAMTDNKRFVGTLPQRISLAFSKRFFDRKLTGTLGVVALFNSNCRMPVFYMETKWLFYRDNMAFLQFSYGGYSNFQVGIGIKAEFFKKLEVFAGTHNILGVIIPARSYGQSIFAGLNFRF
ncbi:MAG: hypothetical protein KJ607_03515 [Bacteroidetes bacterium]|nr:hypothetical protein [Bacteroidota bacterium]